MSCDWTKEKLVASFVHRLGYLDEPQLATILSDWHLDPPRSLVELLVARGVFDAHTRVIVEQAAACVASLGARHASYVAGGKRVGEGCHIKLRNPRKANQRGPITRSGTEVEGPMVTFFRLGTTGALSMSSN
jgi:hypothetical protein